MGKVKNHGEPTNFDFIMAILLLLLFGLMWSVAEKGWLNTILDIFSNMKG